MNAAGDEVHVTTSDQLDQDMKNRTDLDIRGTVVAVCISTEKGVKKYPVEAVSVVPEHGIEGDAHAGTWHRQVSLLAEESIRKMCESGLTLCPGDFAENITTRGIELSKLPIGTRLLVDAVELEVTQIGKECHAACEIRKIVGDCIMPREGIFARVITGGKIRAGNTILVKEPTQDRHSRAVPSGAKESAALKEQKRTMRKETLAARRSLTPDELARRSRAIAERLNSIPEFRDARALLIYVSSKDNEVDTLEPIRNALDDNRMVLVPVAMPSTREILWSQLRSLDDLEPSTFGILEPRNDRVRPVEPTEADVAIIPGIAFDAAGHRIGYGGGYYDRFLGKFRGTKIALAYELQIRDSIPVEPHDLPVDVIVTEQRIIRCR